MTTNRAIWSGGIQVGLMSVPIRLHTAVKEHNAGFNMISPCCSGFVGYDLKCKSCGNPVNRAQTKKGFKVGEEVVVFDPAELEQLLPKSTKTIEVEGFARAEEINFLHASTPYYISPNADPKKGGSPSAVKFYHLLREVLTITNAVAFGKYVRGGKEHLLALRPYQGVLVLQQLHYSDEVRTPPEIEATAPITERERELARTLVEKLSKALDLSKFEDTYQKKVGELIEARLSGKEITSPIEEASKPTTDIVSALEASVQAVA